MNIKAIFTLVLTLLLLPLTPITAFGAPAIEFTPSVKAAFDLTTATTEGAVKNKLNGLYGELSVLKLQDDNRESNIRSLHYNNEQSLTAIRQQIKEIDLTAVTRLEGETAKLKQRYQPLFDQYTALNNRIDLAKKLKDKDLNAILRTQADAMKITVQIARQDIRNKETQLRAAKDARSKKTTAVRKTLSGIDSPQSTIKAQKSVVSALNKRLTADWSDFKAAIRKQNASLTSQSLSSMASQYRQLAEAKQKIIESEQKVAAVIATAKTQLAS
ncbi:hypothetical protein [Paenibacillus sp. GCM10012306]|uniref:hypothetical protein n=1 Tax=Paenibacillus sp. GCM10012306 TaxID=3317342 RepID=UPI0036091F24